jgi:transcriptional regulator with XRE-family HTH domain
MRPLNDIGPQVRMLRIRRGWTQDMLAARLQIGGWDISREGLAKVETRRHQVLAEHLRILNDIFKVGFEAFFPKERVYANGEYPGRAAHG